MKWSSHEKEEDMLATTATEQVLDRDQFKFSFLPEGIEDMLIDGKKIEEGTLGEEGELWVVRRGAVGHPDGPFFIEGMEDNSGICLVPEMFISAADQILEAMDAAVKVGDMTLQQRSRWGTEFSNCQIEFMTRAFGRPGDLTRAFIEGVEDGRRFAQRLGYDLIGFGLAPKGVPDVPSPLDDRYQRFADTMPSHITAAMYRVGALHIHVAACTSRGLFRIYNALVRALPEFAAIGCPPSQHRRRQLFESNIYPAALPITLEGWDEAHAYYLNLGMLDKPKDHWAWVRLSRPRFDEQENLIKPPTVELRIADATTSRERIFEIAHLVSRVIK